MAETHRRDDMVAYNFTGWWTGKRTRPGQLAEARRKIRQGIKTTTIRERARCVAGDQLQLYWGMRQRDCQLLLRTHCVKVCAITLTPQAMHVDGCHFPRTSSQARMIARADGFDDVDLFWSSFENGRPYALIKWASPRKRLSGKRKVFKEAR